MSCDLRELGSTSGSYAGWFLRRRIRHAAAQGHSCSRRDDGEARRQATAVVPISFYYHGSARVQGAPTCLPPPTHVWWGGERPERERPHPAVARREGGRAAAAGRRRSGSRWGGLVRCATRSGGSVGWREVRSRTFTRNHDRRTGRRRPTAGSQGSRQSRGITN